MKNCFILLFLVITIFSVFHVDATNTQFPLIGKTIIIDAGHGGKDYGAIVQGIRESEINLSISKKIKIELENKGAIVLETRCNQNDLSDPNALYRKKSDFDQRISKINNSHADLYLSIHQNIYSNSKYYGPQVFYFPKILDNENIASIMQEELNKYTNTKRKIKITTNTYMYNKINIRGVLIECGFLSNDKERNNLINYNYQIGLAKTITNAIIKYFS